MKPKSLSASFKGLAFQLLMLLLKWPLRKEISRVQKHFLNSQPRLNLSATEFYKTLFYNTLDSISYLRQSKKMHAKVRLFGFEALHKDLQNSTPVCVVSIHYGAYEMLHRALALQGYPVHLVATEPKSQFLTKILHKLRYHNNLHTSPPETAPWIWRKSLRTGGVYAVMADQSRYGKGSVHTFLGRKHRFHFKMVSLCKSAGAELYTIKAQRVHSEHHITLTKISSQHFEDEMVQAFNTWVLEDPLQYVWNYPRLWLAENL